jgi:putative endonuclease
VGVSKDARNVPAGKSTIAPLRYFFVRSFTWSRRLDGASIYILQCADGSYYTGITRRSVEERVSEHAQGLIADCYTFTRRPVKLIFAEHYDRIVDAIAAERRIKGWSRAKKEAYIRGDYAALGALAKRGPRGSD